MEDTRLSPEAEEDGMDVGMSFMEMYEESLKNIREGEVLKGEIVRIDREFVLVDIGYKSEGHVKIDEFLDADGNLSARVGDEVEVLLERRDDENGTITLSKEKAADVEVWERLKNTYENNGIVRGRIVSTANGGFSVDVGVRAFLPGSQVDLQPVRNINDFLGGEYQFKIVKYNRQRGNIVLSRRALLEAERAKKRKETLSRLQEGLVLEGTVKNVVDYGLFVDLGGIDGLVHITDISWGRPAHPSEMHRIGDKVQVKVLNFDLKRERICLGIKQLGPGPWTDAEKRYPVNSRIHGRIVSMNDYGAFVELEPGLEGLVHVSQMSWTQRIRHPSEVVNVGEQIEVMVLHTDASKKRISLGIKQVRPNPWDTVEDKYPVGTIIEGRIRNITDFGIFIGIDEGIDGLVHISDISWTKEIKHPSEIYMKNQEVRAVVLNIDKEKQRFGLGIKQLTRDPWDDVPRKYKPGGSLIGTVTAVTDFGVFVEIEKGVEGLIHISETSMDRRGNPLARFQAEDVIRARVINVSREEKKIALSVRRL